MHQLRVQTHARAVERLEKLLFNCGAVSIAYQDAEDEPILEPPVGDHPIWSSLFIQAHFQTADQIYLASKALQHEESIGSQILLEQIDDDGWQEKFQQQFTAMQFGSLSIYPSWENNPNPNGTSLKLDPGLAFGTGQHATTHLCLQWLSKSTLKNMEVIDFGCGSGILALAAAALGAKHIYAVDIDPQALTATRQNILQNRLSTSRFTIGPVKDLGEVEADILVANILAEPLIKLRDSLLSHLKCDGTLLLSGILSTQAEEIIEHYSAFCSHQATNTRGDWSSIIFKPIN